MNTVCVSAPGLYDCASLPVCLTPVAEVLFHTMLAALYELASQNSGSCIFVFGLTRAPRVCATPQSHF